MSSTSQYAIPIIYKKSIPAMNAEIQKNKTTKTLYKYRMLILRDARN